MGLLANILGTGGKAVVPASTSKESGLDEHQARESQLRDEMDEIQLRIANIERTVLGPLRLEKQQLADVKAKRLKVGAAAFIDGREQDLKALDTDIALREAKIVALEKDTDIANHAMAELQGRISEKRRELELLRQEGMRVRVRQLEIALREHAPQFQAQAEAFKAAIVELSALALARDRIGPLVPGNSQIGSIGLAQVDIGVPHLPAYEKVGGHFNLNVAAEARMRVILAELGIRL
jgi:hypothetical protein